MNAPYACFLREFSRCHDKAAGCAFGSHDTVEFSHRCYANFHRAPLFTLHQKFFVVLRQREINPFIRAAATGFRDRIATVTKRFAYPHLEFLPVHAIDCLMSVARKGLLMQRLALRAAYH